MNQARWENNIKMDYIKWVVMMWTGSQQRPVAGSYEHGNDPSGCMKTDIC